MPAAGLSPAEWLCCGLCALCQGKQASSCCSPSREGYGSEHFCFTLLSDTQIGVIGFNKGSRKQKL